MILHSGREQALPYSFSRWTDVCASPNHWAWLQVAIEAQEMLAFDPRNAIPGRWSLAPDDTLGLVFWTKNADKLLYDAPWLQRYRFHVHITVTGWHEVEHKAPGIRRGKLGLYCAARELGADNVSWRFSPIPLVPDVINRFAEIAEMAAEAGLKRVYRSFLQPNDRLPETRSTEQRLDLLQQIAEKAVGYGIQVLLCNEDRALIAAPNLHPNLASGVCSPPEYFSQPGMVKPPSEGCGCILMVDPFTINETCVFGCEFCYAADKTLSPKKRSTTNRRLTVVR